MKIGLSTGNTTDLSVADWCKSFEKISTDCIEISHGLTDEIPLHLDSNLIQSLANFKWRSIHAPVRVEGEILTYPSSKADKIIEKILELVEKCNIDVVLFHPDIIVDFDYLNKAFGDKLAFENMDKLKTFGKSVEDMNEVFSKSPQAKWVCDVNHIFTLDPSMQLSEDLHTSFGNRLSHYHISSYGEKIHCLFQDSPKYEILKGVMNFDIPMIHEGFGDVIDLPRLENELELVKSVINRK